METTLLVINQKLNSAVVSTLKKRFENCRLAEIPTDLLFPSLKPALAVNIWHYPKNSTEKQMLIASLRTLQDKFKNSVAIIVCNEKIDQEEFHRFQCEIQGGKLRLLYCKQDYTHIIEMICSYLSSLRDVDRMTQQTEFFQAKAETYLSRDQAQSICFDLFKGLGVIEEDWKIFVDAAPSISTIINANQQDMIESNPSELETILKITNFFETYQK